jgi:hypothetical protein
MRRKWVLTGIATGIAVLVAGWLFLGSDENGATFHAGKINANNKVNRSSGYCSSEGAIFFARRIAVVNKSDHPVMKAAACELVNAFRELPFVARVDLLTGEDGFGTGESVYDYFVTLDMPTFESRGLLMTGRKVNATITCSIRPYFRGAGYSSNPQSPMMVNADVNVTLQHASTARGIECFNAKYKLVAQNISEQLSDQATEPLIELAAKFPSPDSLPSGLWPEYRPESADVVPAGERWAKDYSGCGFLLHNETVYSKTTTTPYEDLRPTWELLKECGWELDRKDFKRGEKREFYYFSGTRDHRFVEAFEVGEHAPGTTNEEVLVVFHYSDRMTRDEIGEVFAEEYGDGEIPADVWTRFESFLPTEMNARTLERFAGISGLPLAAEKKVVRYLEQAGRSDEARARLRSAYWAALLESHDAATEMLKLGREIMKDPTWKPEDLTEADLAVLNIPRAKPGEPFEVRVALNEIARYCVGPTNRLEVLSASVKRAEIPEGRYSLAYKDVALQGGERASSTVTPHDTTTPWRATTAHNAWMITAEEIGEDVFKLTITGRE